MKKTTPEKKAHDPKKIPAAKKPLAAKKGAVAIKKTKAAAGCLDISQCFGESKRPTVCPLAQAAGGDNHVAAVASAPLRYLTASNPGPATRACAECIPVLIGDVRARLRAACETDDVANTACAVVMDAFGELGPGRFAPALYTENVRRQIDSALQGDVARIVAIARIADASPGDGTWALGDGVHREAGGVVRLMPIFGCVRVSVSRVVSPGGEAESTPPGYGTHGYTCISVDYARRGTYAYTPGACVFDAVTSAHGLRDHVALVRAVLAWRVAHVHGVYGGGATSEMRDAVVAKRLGAPPPPECIRVDSAAARIMRTDDDQWLCDACDACRAAVEACVVVTAADIGCDAATADALADLLSGCIPVGTGATWAVRGAGVFAPGFFTQRTRTVIRNALAGDAECVAAVRAIARIAAMYPCADTWLCGPGDECGIVAPWVGTISRSADGLLVAHAAPPTRVAPRYGETYVCSTKGGVYRLSDAAGFEVDRVAVAPAWRRATLDVYADNTPPTTHVPTEAELSALTTLQVNVAAEVLRRMNTDIISVTPLALGNRGDWMCSDSEFLPYSSGAAPVRISHMAPVAVDVIAPHRALAVVRRGAGATTRIVPRVASSATQRRALVVVFTHDRSIVAARMALAAAGLDVAVWSHPGHNGALQPTPRSCAVVVRHESARAFAPHAPHVYASASGSVGVIPMLVIVDGVLDYLQHDAFAAAIRDIEQLPVHLGTVFLSERAPEPENDTTLVALLANRPVTTIATVTVMHAKTIVMETGLAAPLAPIRIHSPMVGVAPGDVAGAVLEHMRRTLAGTSAKIVIVVPDDDAVGDLVLYLHDTRCAAARMVFSCYNYRGPGARANGVTEFDASHDRAVLVVPLGGCVTGLPLTSVTRIIFAMIHDARAAAGVREIVHSVCAIGQTACEVGVDLLVPDIANGEQVEEVLGSDLRANFITVVG